MNNRKVGGRPIATALAAMLLLALLPAASLLCAGCASQPRSRDDGRSPAKPGGEHGIRTQGVPIFATPRIVSKGEVAEITLVVSGSVDPERLSDFLVTFKGLIGSANLVVDTSKAPELTVEGPYGSDTLITVKIDTLQGDWETATKVAAVKVSFKHKDMPTIVSTVLTVTDHDDIPGRVRSFGALRRAQPMADHTTQGVPIFAANAEVKASMHSYAPVLANGTVTDATYKARFLDPEAAKDYFEDPEVYLDPLGHDKQLLVQFKGKPTAPKTSVNLEYEVWRSDPPSDASAAKGVIRVQP